MGFGTRAPDLAHLHRTRLTPSRSGRATAPPTPLVGGAHKIGFGRLRPRMKDE